jgi:hypothetical protein
MQLPTAINWREKWPFHLFPSARGSYGAALVVGEAARQNPGGASSTRPQLRAARAAGGGGGGGGFPGASPRALSQRMARTRRGQRTRWRRAAEKFTGDGQGNCGGPMGTRPSSHA